MPNDRSGSGDERRSTLRESVAFVFLLFVAFLVVACQDAEEEAGIDGETPSATPTVTPDTTAVTPSPAPTPTVADAKAPDGCLEGEKAYVDPEGRFAFCYLADMEIVTVQTKEGVGVTAMHSLEDHDRVVVHWAWVSDGRVGRVPDAPCRPAPTVVKNRQFQELLIDGVVGSACLQDHYDAADPNAFLYSTIEVEVPAEGGGVLQIELAFVGSRDGTPAKDLATRVLNSARLDEVAEGS